MNTNDKNISFARIFAFVMVLMIVVVNPVVQTLELFFDSEIELSQIDIEEETDEIEKLKKENYINHNAIDENLFSLIFTLPLGNYIPKKPYLDFVHEIPIPPPDYV